MNFFQSGIVYIRSGLSSSCHCQYRAFILVFRRRCTKSVQHPIKKREKWGRVSTSWNRLVTFVSLLHESYYTASKFPLSLTNKHYYTTRKWDVDFPRNPTITDHYTLRRLILPHPSVLRRTFSRLQHQKYLRFQSFFQKHDTRDNNQKKRVSPHQKILSYIHKSIFGLIILVYGHVKTPVKTKTMLYILSNFL